MSLIRYAGYDPFEDVYEPQPPHNYRALKVRRRPRPGRPAMDVERALELKCEGLSWGRIGEILASEDRRTMKYLAHSVRQAVFKSL